MLGPVCPSNEVDRKIVKCEWTDTFGAIVERVDPSLSHAVVEKVLVSSNAQFLDPVHEIPLDGPVELLKDYGMNVHEYDIYCINFILCNRKLMIIKLITYLITGNQQL